MLLASLRCYTSIYDGFIITNDEASIEQAKQKRFQEDKPQSQKGAGIDIFQAVP